MGLRGEGAGKHCQVKGRKHHSEDSEEGQTSEKWFVIRTRCTPRMQEDMTLLNGYKKKWQKKLDTKKQWHEMKRSTGEGEKEQKN